MIARGPAGIEEIERFVMHRIDCILRLSPPGRPTANLGLGAFHHGFAATRVLILRTMNTAARYFLVVMLGLTGLIALGWEAPSPATTVSVTIDGRGRSIGVLCDHDHPAGVPSSCVKAAALVEPALEEEVSDPDPGSHHADLSVDRGLLGSRRTGPGRTCQTRGEGHPSSSDSRPHLRC
jgi:hypothetical protein